MTLKEKFRTLNLSTWINKNDTEKMEIIADEFSIGFAEWLNVNFKFDFTDNAFKELLEIYKKEKGL